MVNKESGSNYSWLKNCPPSDVGFKSALERADIETIETVLMDSTPDGNKTRMKILESRLRRLRRKNG